MPNELVRTRFFNSSSAGAAWKPLSPKTIKNRVAEGYAPGPPLIRSGALWKGATGGKAFATLQRVVLPFKGRAEKYAFNSRVSGGRNFYAKPNTAEMEKIFAYRDKEILNVITSLLNARKPRIRKPAS